MTEQDSEGPGLQQPRTAGSNNEEFEEIEGSRLPNRLVMLAIVVAALLGATYFVSPDFIKKIGAFIWKIIY